MHLKFNKERHVYTLGDSIIPSVTQIIEPLKNLSAVPQAILEHKRQIGIAVHRACELDDLDSLDELSVCDEVGPYLEAWRRFRRETNAIFGIDGIERQVYNSSLGYAGTLDRLGYLGRLSALIDIKTSARFEPWMGVQLAGYQQAAYESRLTPIDHTRTAVLLHKKGTYSVKVFSDADDWPLFCSMLSLFLGRASGNPPSEHVKIVIRNWCLRNNVNSNFLEEAHEY